MILVMLSPILIIGFIALGILKKEEEVKSSRSKRPN